MRRRPLTEMLSDLRQSNPDVTDYIDFGLRNGIAATRVLALYREHTGAIRTADFMALWRDRRAMFARAATA